MSEPVAPPAKASLPIGYMRDAQGRLVPVELVRPEHLIEDQLVHKLHRDASALSEQLRAFRENGFSEIEAHLDLLAEKFKAERGGQRGNLTLSTFDGSLRVQVAVGDRLELGPELQAAKALVDKCIHAWSKGASVELKAIVNDAFDVDKSGKLNVDRILALRRLSIEDPTWLKAMEAISAAIRVVSTKRYLRLYAAGRDGKLSQVPLDLASV
jgi:hypothetical protein